jgi:hypothetical protein
MKTALAFIAVLALASTAQAQDRVRHRYTQRTDHYAQVFNYWAANLPAEAPFNPGVLFGGAGFVVGTRLTCNVCGAVGHYSCGAAVPLYVSHYTWDMMP